MMEDTVLGMPKERTGVVLFEVCVVAKELAKSFVGGLVVMVDIVEELLSFFQSIYKGCLTHIIQISQANYAFRSF